jgi:D-alanyl-D-alanine carboxypeptidase (penicillin-binding protein 5/6)
MKHLVFCCGLLALPLGSVPHAPKKVMRPAAMPVLPEKALPDPNVIIFPGAQNLVVQAKQAILIHYNTGRVLMEKNADERMPPSSMTKIMTAYLLEEALLKGTITESTLYPVSKKAWETQGSKMFVPLGAQVSVGDLLKGIAIQSGNDASIVAAEGLWGNEELFAGEMNKMASSLGMTNTYFKNASGLPDEGHYSTARDLAKLGAAMVKNHPKFYAINKEKTFTYNGITQGNRNPLLYENNTCDGIKTGHTDAGGFGMVASCVDGDQRYILVINGLSSMKERADASRQYIAWAFANFTARTVVKKGDIIEKAAKVETGKKEAIPLIASKDVTFLTLRTDAGKPVLKSDLLPLKAPITEGTRAGTVTASMGNEAVQVDLLAAESVEKLGLIGRAMKLVGLK